MDFSDRGARGQIQRLLLFDTLRKREVGDLAEVQFLSVLSISQGRGSRVRVVLNGVRAVFHQLHPQREAPKGTVKGVRDFLESAGISDGDDLLPEDEDN